MTRRSSKSPSQRQLRVGEEVRQALAHVLERGDVRDPGLDGVGVTVTEVRMSPDLRNASVFVAPLGGGGGDELIDALTRARPFLRRRVAKAVRLRYAPDLRFVADRTFDDADHMTALLHDLDADDGGKHGT